MPMMSPENTGLVEAIVVAFREYLGQRVQQDFGNRRRRRIRIASSGYPRRYWGKVVELASSFGEQPVLLVPFDPIGRDISGWLYGQAGNKPDDLRVEWSEGRQNGGGVGYVGTVEGIDVYTAQLPAHQSLLFSATALGSITYSRLPSGAFVDVVFHDGEDPWKSLIVVKFSQSMEWKDSPIMDLAFEAKERWRTPPAASASD